MSSFEGIIAWAQDLEAWEADLIRRLLIDNTLAVGLSEVSANLAAHFKIHEPNGSICIKPLMAEERARPTQEFSDEKFSICSIHSVSNINALNSTSRLDFGHDGITIIYGENGSGKSGYSRILKNACHAKHEEREILRNIYNKSISAQSATIGIKIGDIKSEWIWQPNNQHPLLKRINVYDVDCGKELLDKNNQVSFKPEGAEAFDNATEILDLVRAEINKLMKDATPPTIQNLEHHPDRKFEIDNIGQALSDENVVALTSFTAEEDEELNKVKLSIQNYENGTTISDIEKINTIVSSRLPRAIQRAKIALGIFTPEKSELISSLAENLATTKKAYELALSAYSTTDPLSGIHSPEWKRLFEAAREFSEKLAYPGEAYPKGSSQTSCVLCMQELTVEAKERLLRFDRYIADKTQKDFEQASRFYQDALSGIKACNIPEQDTYEPLVADLIWAVGSDGGLGNVFITLHHRKSHFAPSTQDKFVAYNTDPIDIDLLETTLKAELQKRIQTLTESLKPEQYQANIAKKKRLELNQEINKKQVAFVDYRNALLHNRKVTAAAASITTTKQRFSTKSRSIISQYVTPEFVNNFQNELTALGMDTKIEISPIVRTGDTSHAFSLMSKKPGKVLSEGEQKVISIAAFLAELKTFKNKSPIILDDPVTSLDHVYRERIASRLVKECISRQVIIFTHDLSLIMEIEGKLTESALKGETPSKTIVTIRRNGTDSGLCVNKAPWRGMSTSSRMQYLVELLAKFKNQHNSDIESYNQRAAYLYCLLREAWEASIEQDLFGDVVTRGRNSIQTLRLPEIFIDDDDIKTIEFAMSRCSTWMFGHDKSRNLAENRPSPEEITSDIDELRAFSKVLVKRRESTKDRRKKSLQPAATDKG